MFTYTDGTGVVTLDAKAAEAGLFLGKTVLINFDLLFLAEVDSVHWGRKTK